MADTGKKAAGEAAALLIENGMTVGLGTGSTASFFIQALARRIQNEGLQIRGVPTSRAAEKLAREHRIPVFPLDGSTCPDITVDGADEADSDLNLIKGGGAALVEEKLVASSSREMLVIVDEKKVVSVLGEFPLPVAIIPFGHETTLGRVQKEFPEVPVKLRLDTAGEPVETDDGLYILDLSFGPSITDPQSLLQKLRGIVGVADAGLFVGIASRLLVGREDGSTFVITR